MAAASNPTNVEQKACSFSANRYVFTDMNYFKTLVCEDLIFGLSDRWVSADEDDQVCGCCDATCGIRSGSDQLHKGMCFFFFF